MTHNPAAPKRCSRCLALENPLTRTRIGPDGICNFCKVDANRYHTMSWSEKKQLFEAKLAAKQGQHTFDGVIMMSGGKDSAYLALTLRKEYGLKLLGVSIDNGFEYEDSFLNAKKICDRLDIPYIIYQPAMPGLREFYRYILTEPDLGFDDYSQVCLYCGNYLKCQADRFARQMDAAYIFSGFNPDQAFELGEAELVEADPGRKDYQKMIRSMLAEKFRFAQNYTHAHGRPELTPYFDLPQTEILYYYQHVPYQPYPMMEAIKKDLAWEPIQRFRKNYLVSGCQLVCALVYLCRERGIADYIQKEFSSQIRRGVLTKEQVEQVSGELQFPREEIDQILARIGLSCHCMLAQSRHT